MGKRSRSPTLGGSLFDGVFFGEIILFFFAGVPNSVAVDVKVEDVSTTSNLHVLSASVAMLLIFDTTATSASILT